MKKNGEGSKAISCFGETRRDSSERWRGGGSEGEMLEMKKFVEFWGGIWEREERTLNMPLTEEIRRQSNEKVNHVNEFSITFEKVKNGLAKRKGWTAPGIDRIQNCWWKKLDPTQKGLTRAFTKFKEDNMNIRTW